MRERTLLCACQLLLLLLGLGGCGPNALLSEVTITPNVLSPNGDGESDSAILSYRIARAATVSIWLRDKTGNSYAFRRAEPRPPGHYAATFYGTYQPEEGKPYRRVLPSGTYTVVITAQAGPAVSEASGQLEIRNADTNAPAFHEVRVLPNPFSPNEDALEDETVITYSLSKSARVSLFATDATGREYLLEPEKELSAAWHSVRWKGQAGGRLVPDGTYALHLRARDGAGNVTEHTTPLTVEGGGTPRLEITDVRIEPAALPVGGTLRFTVTVKNTGETTLKSLGPSSGTPYDTVNNFLQFADEKGEPRYYERPGYWRIGVQWEQAASPYPVRWGWGDGPLRPSEEVTVTGTVRVLIPQTNRVTFWVNVIQEGVGFPRDPVGHKRITVSY